jgi:hypothetical protein
VTNGGEIPLSLDTWFKGDKEDLPDGEYKDLEAAAASVFAHPTPYDWDRAFFVRGRSGGNGGVPFAAEVALEEIDEGGMSIPAELRRETLLRAAARCEYCRLSQRDFTLRTVTG